MAILPVLAVPWSAGRSLRPAVRPRASVEDPEERPQGAAALETAQEPPLARLHLALGDAIAERGE